MAVSSDDKPKRGTPEDISISDPDLPGLSSVFSTTRSGLKPLRRRTRNTGEMATVEPADKGDDGQKDSQDTSPDETAADQAPPETDSFEKIADGPSVPPDSKALDVPEPGVSPPVDGIQLRAGLSLVDTAEMPVHRPPEEPAALGDPDKPKATAGSPPAPATPAARTSTPPVPPSRPRTTQSARPPAALMDDSSARRAVGPAPSSSSNWLLYMIVLAVALGLIGVLLVTFLEL
jgi:hypothetical protein